MQADMDMLRKSYSFFFLHLKRIDEKRRGRNIFPSLFLICAKTVSSLETAHSFSLIITVPLLPYVS